MFQFQWFRTPKQQHEAFLSQQNSEQQTLSPEYENAINGFFDSYKKTQSEPLSASSQDNFWVSYLKAFPTLFYRVIAIRTVTTLLILTAILISEQLLANVDDYQAALTLLLLFAGVSFIGTWFDSLGVLTNERLMSAARLHTFKKVVNQLLVLDRNRSASLTTSGRLKTLASSDVDTIADFVAVCAWNLLPGLLALILLTPVAIYKMGLAGFAAILIAVLVVPYAIFLSRWVEKQEDQLKSRLDDLATIVGEWVRQVRLIRYLSWQGSFADAVAIRVRRLLKSSIKLQTLFIVTFGISVVWWMFCVVTLIYVAQWNEQSYELTELFATIWIITQICNSVRFMPIVFIFYASASACVRRIEGLCRLPLRAELFEVDNSKPLLADLKASKLIFNKVSLVINDQVLLDEINGELDLNQSTAIVGEVSAGKTLLLQLITGEIKPTSGEIEIQLSNGQRINLWNLQGHQHWRQQIAYVPQESYLSSATVEENIDLSDNFEGNEASEIQSKAVSKSTLDAVYLAQLEADLEQLPKGLQEEVGESGVNLSGGQKQRISLARAFQSKRPIFILDDPLSAVDTNTERLMTEAIFSAASGILLVTHRLAPVNKCDQLWMLESGKLIEQGNPSELVNDPDSHWHKLAKFAEKAANMDKGEP